MNVPGSKGNPIDMTIRYLDDREVRLRCIEAAARNPHPHPDGYPAAILSVAKVFSTWVLEGDKPAEGVAGLL
jgi:hypothetical protein